MIFSERMGFVVPKTIVQKDTMDSDLKNCLWNTFYTFCAEPYNNILASPYGLPEKSRRELANWNLFFKNLWCLFLKKPLDDLSLGMYGSLFTKLNNFYFKFEFYQVYDFTEFVSKNIPYKKYDFIENCNKILELEISAYRFIDEQLAPITSDIEINEIKTALSNSDKFRPASEHINKALEHFSNKINPDYRNSIKESISAVEATCCIICGSENATLSEALKAIEKSNAIDLHPALKSSFAKLYGYTSDGDGIRHALSGESNLSEEDARFMLISCSAFTNYLIVKYNKKTETI